MNGNEDEKESKILFFVMSSSVQYCLPNMYFQYNYNVKIISTVFLFLPENGLKFHLILGGVGVKIAEEEMGNYSCLDFINSQVFYIQELTGC